MMTEAAPTSGDENNEDSFDEDGELSPPTERWAPIGASGSGEETTPTKVDAKPGQLLSATNIDRLRELEEEQDQLNSSLLALTTHFAQVQFRLKQIGEADSEDKERLLKELEQFAFKGCPDVTEVKRHRTWHSNAVGDDSAEHQAIMEQQRAKQMQLIGQLKDQLQDLEQFAYDTGDGGLPSNEVLEKQKAVLDQLHQRMDLNLELDKMSQEDLQKHVDMALKQLINPMKVKEQLVEQLQTQITDLERFVEFLQGEGAAGGRPAFKCCCETDPSNCLLHNVERRRQVQQRAQSTASSFNQYLLSQLGCQSNKFQKNELKKSTKGNHWGDLRAALELSVGSLLAAVTKHMSHAKEPRSQPLKPYDSDEDDVEDVFEKCHEEIVTAVRRDFCPALRDLLQHGLQDQTSVNSSGLGAFGCFPARQRRPPSPGAGGVTQKAPEHAWDPFVRYFDMKHGREFSEAPVRKLSQSFNLNSIGGRSVTSRQLLLTTIENIRTSHEKLKRSPDAMFKAFVSAALNSKKLVARLRMVLRTREIVEECYAPWSYVAKTGCEDVYALLEKLQQFDFDLPVDLAVRPFQHIKDAF
uniref:RUN domain-containing protein n=2 Tax=Plectus sambesii TaxID=2011161 RepID=A0A914VCF6_9BILA